jgi:hypothetical protein
LLQLVLVFPRAQSSNIKSPDEFLPYTLGSRFTPHHLLVDYFRYVDGLSDKMQLVQYGQTNELRPLIAAIISSPANMKRIETIRQNNLRRTGMLDGSPVDEDIAIVYLSYSVHGDEAAGSESAMAVLYDLIKGGAPYDTWLENTVVIIDPSLNPDGYNRFTQWSNSVSSSPNNPHPNAREHSQPWPGGRANHYYFDLNRDWVWQTQEESRDRVAFYLQWMPHIHADLHEMEPESPYYFAPASQPYHADITQWQADFQVEMGKNHASHFDANGWRYYTGERFDLFYPGFGDTYPTFAGAIGMTYEQGGSGYANRAVLLRNGDTLTLKDRIEHHHAASLSTIEVGSKHAQQLVDEFSLYFKKAVTDPPGPFRSYVIKASNNPGRVEDLLQLLSKQGIIYGNVRNEQKGIKGISYLNGEEAAFNAQQGDIIVPAAQPRAVLAHILFEPEGHLADSLSYDITAWCLPLAYGLDAFATELKLDYAPYQPQVRTKGNDTDKPYAYVLQWGSVAAARSLATFLSQGISARYSPSSFKLDGITYPPGTVLMMRADNRRFPQFDMVVKYIATATNASLTSLRTGFVDTGNDLGSDDYKLIQPPSVLTFAGDGVSSLNLGEIWYFFEQELHYPIDIADIDDAGQMSFDSYSLIILPEGYYSLGEDVLEKLNAWTDGGGRLVAIGSAVGKLAGKKGFAIQVKTTGMQESKKDSLAMPDSYAAGDRKSLSYNIPGAVFQTTLDYTNPLTFGLGQSYWTLKTSPSSYAWLNDRGNAIYLDDTPHHYGFAGYKALENSKKSLIAGQQRKGSGNVIYLVDNPLFRAFWNSGKVLFSNALFF